MVNVLGTLNKMGSRQILVTIKYKEVSIILIMETLYIIALIFVYELGLPLLKFVINK